MADGSEWKPRAEGFGYVVEDGKLVAPDPRSTAWFERRERILLDDLIPDDLPLSDSEKSSRGLWIRSTSKTEPSPR